MRSSLAATYLDIKINKLNISLQCTTAATTANQTLGCTCWVISSRDIIPLYLVLVRLLLVYCVLVLVHTIKKKYSCGQTGEGLKDGHGDDQRKNLHNKE